MQNNNDNSHQQDNKNIKDTHLLDKFNWGAFLLAPIWCFTYNRFILGVLIGSIFVSLRTLPDFSSMIVLFIIGEALSIYVGFSANKYLWEKYRDKYSSVSQLIENQNNWAGFGVIAHIIFAIFVFTSF